VNNPQVEGRNPVVQNTGQKVPLRMGLQKALLQGSSCLCRNRSLSVIEETERGVTVNAQLRFQPRS
jgi:septal ring-binding cell division protein DamX